VLANKRGAGSDRGGVCSPGNMTGGWRFPNSRLPMDGWRFCEETTRLEVGIGRAMSLEFIMSTRAQPEYRAAVNASIQTLRGRVA